jgi:predicted DNA-binding transcriptional regulator YafY
MPATMPARAARAHTATRLRAALLTSRAWTYAELAREGGCTERTVRNFLKVAPDAFGFAIRRDSGPDRLIRVRMADAGGRETIDALAHELARDMLRRIFPVAGTTLDTRAKAPRAQIVVAVRGARAYEERHLSALRAWLVAAAERPRVALKFTYGNAERGERIVWPLGAVVRDLARVYLAGVPDDADDARDVRTYALEKLVLPAKGRGVAQLHGEDAGTPPSGIDRAVVEHAIDLPFSIFPADHGDGVHVKVRFAPRQAAHLRGRIWHRKQRTRELSDGGLELAFGPADLGEATAWVRQWGRSVTVLGDDALVAALRKDPGPVLPKR